ncbi:DUF4704 domain-containing protein containing protein [Pelomyxa schiedti]|nr:DUF4704 domain-containing protein containing protein [Pelomyxa schiedti]
MKGRQPFDQIVTPSSVSSASSSTGLVAVVSRVASMCDGRVVVPSASMLFGNDVGGAVGMRKGASTMDGVWSTAQKIADLFGTFVTLTPADQANVLSGLKVFLNAFTSCIPLCSEVGLMGKFIDALSRVSEPHIFDELMNVIGMLGSHHITAPEVKHLLNLLCSPSLNVSSTLKPATETNLASANTTSLCCEFPTQEQRAKILETLLVMSQRQAPDRYFLLTGDKSGIDIGCGPEDMPQSYAFSVWVWVDQFRSAYPRLVCFLAPSNSGVELFIRKDTIGFRTNVNNIVTCTYTFHEKRWYHIVVCHCQSNWSKLFNAKLQFFINGDLINDTTLKFPSSSERFQFHCLGYGGVVNLGMLQPQAQMYLHGRLATIAMIYGVVTLPLASAVFNKGPDFCLTNTSLSPLAGSSHVTVAFCYSPKACTGKYCYNVAEQATLDERPTALPTKLFWQPQRKVQHTKTRGTLLDGARCVFGERLVTSLHSATGIKVLLPLFHSLNVAMYGPHCLSLAIRLLGSVLKSSEAATREAQNTGVLRILGSSLLENIPRTFFSKDLVESVLELVESVSHCGEKLQRHSYSHVLLNFGLWRAAEFSLQQFHLAQYFRKIFGVNSILHVLRYFYSLDSATPNSTEFSHGEQLLLPHFASLTREEIKSLRSYICTILKLLLKQDDITKEETDALLHYFTTNVECDELEDVLGVLQHVIANPPKIFLQHLEEIGVVLVLYSLLVKPKESLRIKYYFLFMP